MELMAWFGFAAKELFTYNRENFQFDQGQRIEREMLRLEMQVKRFELFREDIRDLVELTVGKMEMYHLVGALFLEFCIALYCEGRIEERASPYIIGLFYMSVASAFLYLVLAVWLSMHASICSQSFGTRLLTRYVRLPIPSEGQLMSLNARLADFERQGGQVLRVPLVGGQQDWMQRQALAPISEDTRAPALQGPASSSSGPDLGGRPGGHAELLGRGERALGEGEADLLDHSRRRPGRHVQLFRRLQAKWQCFDAYARVAMSMGVNQILFSITFFLIIVTNLQYRAPEVCFALVIPFQTTIVAITYLDITHSSTVVMVLLILLQLGASLIPAVYLATAKYEYEVGEDGVEYVFVDAKVRWIPVSYFLIAMWFEIMIRLVKPSNDEAHLPRRFRAVLFLDVFEDLGEDPGPGRSVEGQDPGRQRSKISSSNTKKAQDSLTLVRCAIRRWESVPAGMSNEQAAELKRARTQLRTLYEMLNGELALRAARGRQQAGELLEMDDRPWNEMLDDEQEADPFANVWTGPFQQQRGLDDNSTFYFDLEANEFRWELTEDKQVLQLSRVLELLAMAGTEVRRVLSEDEDEEREDTEANDDTKNGSDGAPRGGTSGSDGEGDPAALAVVGRRTTRMANSFLRRHQAGSLLFTPQRLPWQVVHMATRTVQFSWIGLGVMSMLTNFGLLHFDEQIILPEEHEGHSEHGEHSEIGENSEHGEHSEPSDSGERSEHPETTEQGESLDLGAGSPSEHGEASAAHESAGHDGGHAGRRLQPAASWRFNRLSVDWPGGEFFLPESLHCAPLPARPLSGPLLLGGALGVYEALRAGAAGVAEPLQLSPLTHALPRGAVALCGGPEWRRPAQCLFGATEDGALAFWLQGNDTSARERVSLRLEGALSWNLMAGAAVPCDNVSSLLLSSHDPSPEWCLLLAGWDGRRLPVAAVPLRSGPGRPPEATEVVTPLFDAPLRAGPSPPKARAAGGRRKARRLVPPAIGRQLQKKAARLQTIDQRGKATTCASMPSEEQEALEVSALHLEHRSGRLWAVLSSGELVAWGLLQPQTLGRWRPQWHSADADAAGGRFRPVAACEDDGALLVLGRAGDGPRLLRSPLPSELSKTLASA